MRPSVIFLALSFSDPVSYTHLDVYKRQYFTTGLEFRPTLMAQRDDAATKGQTRRVQIYDQLLTAITEEQAS